MKKNGSFFTESKHSASMTIKSVTVSPGKAAVGGSCDAEESALSTSWELWIAVCRLSFDYDPWENTCVFQGITKEVQKRLFGSPSNPCAQSMWQLRFIITNWMHGNIIVGIKSNALLNFFLHMTKSLVLPLFGFYFFCSIVSTWS